MNRPIFNRKMHSRGREKESIWLRSSRRTKEVYVPFLFTWKRSNSTMRLYTLLAYQTWYFVFRAHSWFFMLRLIRRKDFIMSPPPQNAPFLFRTQSWVLYAPNVYGKSIAFVLRTKLTKFSFSNALILGNTKQRGEYIGNWVIGS